MVLLTLLSQKVVERPKFEYGFYWNYKGGPYFSILSLEGEEVREEAFFELDDRAENFALIGDTLIISTQRGCFSYLLTYKSKKPINLGKFPNCTKFSFFAYDTGGVYLGTPKGKVLKIYRFLNGKFEEFKVKNFDKEVKICDAVEGDFVCGINSADADDGAFLDDSTYFVIKGKVVRVFRNERIIFSRKFERFPLSVSLSREILYISTVDGIHISDIRTGAEGFAKFPAIKVYASRYSFLVLAEDLEGCINIFKSSLRPPSLLFLGRVSSRSPQRACF